MRLFPAAKQRYSKTSPRQGFKSFARIAKVLLVLSPGPVSSGRIQVPVSLSFTVQRLFRLFLKSRVSIISAIIGALRAIWRFSGVSLNLSGVGLSCDCSFTLCKLILMVWITHYVGDNYQLY